MVAGGLIYGLLRRRGRIRPMPFWLFLLIGVAPIALDGFSQLFSQFFVAWQLEPLMRLFPLRESSPLLRSLTGVLFGLSIVWLVYPRLDEQFSMTADDIARRLARRAEQTGAAD